jgi:hypothetical protein
MLSARIQAGNNSFTQGEIPTPARSTSALTSPAAVSHLEMISVRRAMVNGGQREHRRHPQRIDVQQDPGDVAAQRKGARTGAGWTSCPR